MPTRILIANRGEIAMRIMRACRTQGMEVVAVFTEVDRNLPHLPFAVRQIKVKSYLDIDDVVMAGKLTGCDAVHPGYGLLSENADFARRVTEAGLKFIGPSAEHIAALGDKVRARAIFKDLGIEPIPGSDGPVQSAVEIEAIAEQIGYPLVIKAAFGGGGRGIRAVRDNASLDELLGLSRGEAGLSFGQDDVFVEKMLQGARHVEVQILGDGRGHCVHLGSRDCSVQRRYQKLIEEAPAPLIAPQLLADLADSAVTAMAELGYESAATLEFLYVNEQFYFLEVNTRLQVEHPVTEEISGHDIVSSQLFIAQNKTLPFEQKDVELHGHALELRILAEDGEGQPSPGVIQCLELPGGPGVRVDSHLAVGYRVPHQYDSLIAKLVIWATDRDTAIARARQALAEFKIEGVQTNIARLLQLISAPDFATVNIHTTWAPK